MLGGAGGGGDESVEVIEREHEADVAIVELGVERLAQAPTRVAAELGGVDLAPGVEHGRDRSLDGLPGVGLVAQGVEDRGAEHGRAADLRELDAMAPPPGRGVGESESGEGGLADPAAPVEHDVGLAQQRPQTIDLPLASDDLSELDSTVWIRSHEVTIRSPVPAVGVVLAGPEPAGRPD